MRGLIIRDFVTMRWYIVAGFLFGAMTLWLLRGPYALRRASARYGLSFGSYLHVDSLHLMNTARVKQSSIVFP